MTLTPKRPSRAARDAMDDAVFLDWARMWIHCGRLGWVDAYRAREILEKQLRTKVSWVRAHIVWLLDNPGCTFPAGCVIIHLDDDESNDRPANLLLLRKQMACSQTAREWWRKNAYRKRVVYSRD